MKRACLPAFLASAVLAAAAPPACATWSIVLIDLRTGEVALGSATCLTSFDLRAGTPVLVTGVGGATAQSFVDSSGQNRVFVRDGLLRRTDPAQILTGLATFDTGHQTRQYGMGDTTGRVATFTGTGAGQWAGGRTGSFVSTHLGRTSTIAYAIQGNVLSGGVVVDNAVATAINTTGDLAAKMMAAMDAARLAGGDGRCSCSAGAPTSCGPTPPSFTKSSHIAYMLIARSGDRDGATGVYRAGSFPVSVVARDFTGDGRPDLAVANQNTSNISIMPNVTVPGSPFTMIGGPINLALVGTARDVQAADLDGDGLDDLICVNAGVLSTFRGLGGGSFGPRVDIAGGGSGMRAAIGDFDGKNGPDVAMNSAETKVYLNDGAGGLSLTGGFPVATTPLPIAAADFNGDRLDDLAVEGPTANTLAIFLSNGDGTFRKGTEIAVTRPLGTIAAFDADGDTDADLAWTSPNAATAFVALNDGTGAFGTPRTTTLTFTAADLGVGDVNGDGRPDLVPARFTNFAVLLGQPGGLFPLARTYTDIGSPNDSALADLNGDGKLDIAFAATTSVLTIDNVGDPARGVPAGTFNDGTGCATGDYFMNFNVAFQSAASLDPVLQLRLQYDQWRNTLLVRADAVQSDAAFDRSSIPADGSSSALLTIRLRDWQGAAVDWPASSVRVVPAPQTVLLPASAAVGKIGPVEALGGGVYIVRVEAGLVPGLDRYSVEATPPIAGRRVVVMPDPTLRLESTCYVDCDSNGRVDVLDFACFQNKFALADLYANCNGDTLPGGGPRFDVLDFTCFQNKFALGCP